jgi:hypothetical protein
MIFRTAIEEIIVRTDAENKTLRFIIHWKGGTHTQFEMERPRAATECATPMEALEIIRRMALRQGDDQIASVLNRLGYSTGEACGPNRAAAGSDRAERQASAHFRTRCRGNGEAESKAPGRIRARGAVRQTRDRAT